MCKYCQLSGQCISWVTELRYLGIFVTCSRIFTCSTDSAKRSFYRSANAIFGKVGRIASEETVLDNQDQMHSSVDVWNVRMFAFSKTTRLSHSGNQIKLPRCRRPKGREEEPRQSNNDQWSISRRYLCGSTPYAENMADWLNAQIWFRYHRLSIPVPHR